MSMGRAPCPLLWAAALGGNTQEDHLILLREFFAVCQENHTRLKLEKCEFMQETMQYLGFDVVMKVPTRTGPRCAPSACYPC